MRADTEPRYHALTLYIICSWIMHSSQQRDSPLQEGSNVWLHHDYSESWSGLVKAEWCPRYV